LNTSSHTGSKSSLHTSCSTRPRVRHANKSPRRPARLAVASPRLACGTVELGRVSIWGVRVARCGVLECRNWMQQGAGHVV
jgi:hypothetical protein